MGTITNQATNEKTFYIVPRKDSEEGCLYIVDDETDKYLWFNFGTLNGNIIFGFICPSEKPFSEHMKKMMPGAEPKHISKLDILPILKAYRDTFYVA